MLFKLLANIVLDHAYTEGLSVSKLHFELKLRVETPPSKGKYDPVGTVDEMRGSPQI